MFRANRTQLPNGRGVHCSIRADDRELSYRKVIELWQRDEAFRETFLACLTDVPSSAFRWETPPVTEATVDRVFEFVAIDSPDLERAPDRYAFREHFGTASVATFDNLGKDATLVVPCPTGDDSGYAHLAAFLRNAPRDQQHELFRAVGEAMSRRLGSRPVWLSTAGAGVPWLHVRLDGRPKYYSYEPFRRA